MCIYIHIYIYIYIHILQNVAMRAHLKQTIAKCMEMWPFCENPVCPGIVWKPVTGRLATLRPCQDHVVMH